MQGEPRQKMDTQLTHELLDAINAKQHIAGYTHNFYRYPARISPWFVREAIRQFSTDDHIVLDPFMGGGTTIVEALTMGRRAIGNDLNPLAHFVTEVKTTPLTESDFSFLDEWRKSIGSLRRGNIEINTAYVTNLPWHIQQICVELMARINLVPFERRRRFARCALLKTLQKLVDCKKRIPSSSEIVNEFCASMDEMMHGVREFTLTCQAMGLHKNHIRGNRLLLCRSTSGIEGDRRLKLWPKASLVLTSPPYPSVHILYHRWQVNGRKETPAPYWVAALKDGHTASHYTFGGRSHSGLKNYFHKLEECFRSVRSVISPTALIVQMVAFSHAVSQLPQYLKAMERAGYREADDLAHSAQEHIWRQVPNRRWYCHNGKEQDSTKEIVLFHRPA